MAVIQILWGQVFAVLIIALLGVWTATQWAAQALGFQAELGPPGFWLGH